MLAGASGFILMMKTMMMKKDDEYHDYEDYEDNGHDSKVLDGRAKLQRSKKGRKGGRKAKKSRRGRNGKRRGETFSSLFDFCLLQFILSVEATGKLDFIHAQDSISPCPCRW